MPTIAENARLLKAAVTRGQFDGWRKMYTGRRTDDGITLSGASDGKCWVRADETSREETQVWGNATRVNVPVWVGPNIAGELEIKTVEQAEAAMTAGAAAAASILPTITPENNPNVLIGGRQFKPGRMRLSDLGGLYVYVEPFHYPGGYWPGGSLELTPPGTASTQAWVAVALNPADGTLYAFQGDEYALPVVMSEAALPNIAITAGYIPVGAVVLYNGQTAITGDETWADLRYHQAAAEPRQALFSLAGAQTVQSWPLRIYNATAVNFTITKVFLSVGTAPTGASLIVDVNNGGVTIFTVQANRPAISAAAYTGSTTTIDLPIWAAGEYLTVDVDQIGSTIAGSDLTVHVVYQ